MSGTLVPSNGPTAQPEPWGFPGAGILALVVIVLCLVVTSVSFYMSGKIDGRHQCFAGMRGYDY